MLSAKSLFWKKRNWRKFRIMGALKVFSGDCQYGTLAPTEWPMTNVENEKIKQIKALIESLIEGWPNENEKLKSEREFEKNGKRTCCN